MEIHWNKENTKIITLSLKFTEIEEYKSAQKMNSLFIIKTESL